MARGVSASAREEPLDRVALAVEPLAEAGFQCRLLLGRMCGDHRHAAGLVVCWVAKARSDAIRSRLDHIGSSVPSDEGPLAILTEAK